MLNSNRRKQALSGWLKEHHREVFFSSLKLQKFLFFYEALTKIDNEPVDFSYLRGYSNGPVFSDVYGDYTYRLIEFMDVIDAMYQQHPELINDERVAFTGFLVSILNEADLSGITHELNIWKKQEDKIRSGQFKNIALNPEDLDDKDVELLRELQCMYPPEYITSVSVISIGDKNFVISPQDLEKLTEDSRQVFIELANEDSLQNPVYVSVSDEGVVLVD